MAEVVLALRDSDVARLTGLVRQIGLDALAGAVSASGPPRLFTGFTKLRV